MEIITNNYNELVENVKKCMYQTQQNIAKVFLREKVLFNWNIGKLITEYLNSNTENGLENSYGKKLIEQLSKDTSLNSRSLYTMKNFYKAYPELPDENNLSWSHYKILGELKDEEQRKLLQDLTIENNWTTEKLADETKKMKKTSEADATDTELLKKNLNEPASSPEIANISESELNPSRGILYTYKLKIFGENPQKYLDCGFNFFKPIETDLTEDGLIVETIKNGDEYSFKKSEVPHEHTNTYKAVIERVVDGDTLIVNLDLGFGILHREILRLKGINAPELDTGEGKISAKALTDIASGLDFVIVKTIKTDIYGRYVADVYLPQSREALPQGVADAGEYLNKILLDKGFAERLVM